MSELRILGTKDQASLYEFLERYIDSSVILLSSAERAGLEDQGEKFQGTYVAHFENGAITAVAAHYSREQRASAPIMKAPKKIASGRPSTRR